MKREVRHRQRHAPRQTLFGQRLVRWPGEAAAGERHHHMLQRAELRERRPALQARMPCPPGQHVAFVEEHARVQATRRAHAGVKEQVDLTALQLPRHARRHGLHHGQPRVRRRGTQPGQRRQQDGRLGIVGRGNAPGGGRLGRIERPSWRHCTAQRFKRLAQRLAQFIGARGGPHAALRGHQQRVVERFAQLGELHAHRGLRQVQPLGRTRDIALGQQRVERDQQVEVKAAEIVHGNSWNSDYSFPIYRHEA